MFLVNKLAKCFTAVMENILLGFNSVVSEENHNLDKSRQQNNLKLISDTTFSNFLWKTKKQLSL